MDHYLGERYLPATARGDIVGDSDRLQSAARIVGAVRLVQTLYVPRDEICLYLFEADSADLVSRAAAAAAIALEQVQRVDATLGMPS
jgi:hypothetical protein